MRAGSQERDDEAGVDEYEFLYIAPPEPSKNWKTPGRIRWTNLTLLILTIVVGVCLLRAVYLGLRELIRLI